MKKLALVLTLFAGAATASYAQEAKQSRPVPAFAQPKNEAEKPLMAKAQAETDEMVKSLKLDDRQALTLLEINTGMERRAAAVQNSNAADKKEQLERIEKTRMDYYAKYLTPKQFDTYKRKTGKE